MSIDPNTGCHPLDADDGPARAAKDRAERGRFRGSRRHADLQPQRHAQVAPPQITSTPPTTGVVGQLYLYQVAVTAGITAIDPTGGLIYTLTSSPAGMTIDSNTGAIQWTPTNYGNVPVAIEVQDILGQAVTQTYTINVALTPPRCRR